MIQWYGSGAFASEKFRRDVIAQAFALIAPVRPDLHRVSHNNEMVPIAPKHYETRHTFSFWSNGMDQMPPLQKNSNATSLDEYLH